MDAQELFFKLSKWQRYLIVFALCAALLGGFVYLVVLEDYQRIGKLNKQINQIQMDILNQQKILQQGPKLKAKIKELKERLQTMVASLPEKQDIEELLKKITELLSETNLVAKRFVPGAEKVNEELYYATIPIKMDTQGDYQKQGAFLVSLNELPRIVNVPRISLSKGGGGGREGKLARQLGMVLLNADINGVTYRRLSKEEIDRIMQKKKQKKGRRRGRRR